VPAHTLVQLTGIRHSYAEGASRRRVLDDLELTVPKGELLAVLGRSGSGKSTILNLISGIDLPEAGEIHLGGQRLDQLEERQRTGVRRREIGFIFQFFNLLPTLTVAENVRLPLQLNRLDNADSDRRLYQLLEQVGLAGYGPRYPDTLSGGEQQRVALARALIHEPPLILADEPTGNLDADTGAQVFGLLENLVRESGRTLIMVTHNTELAARADRVLRLQRGQLTRETAFNATV